MLSPQPQDSLEEERIVRDILPRAVLGLVRTMDEGRERDNTSRKGGLPSLPGFYRSTIQPSRRGFYRIHVCEGEITGDNIYRCQSVCPVVLNDFEFFKENITSQTL
jgi:hypothetical protein